MRRRNVGSESLGLAGTTKDNRFRGVLIQRERLMRYGLPSGGRSGKTQTQTAAAAFAGHPGINLTKMYLPAVGASSKGRVAQAMHVLADKT
ncbi:hypothetical protein [Oligosphaera ethanolica]|uniref:hypothetical protein n=1 Tax=Oligosphaera ethanolica TaxID=760260 RepID=UPI0027D8522D|nr:hypothetical protein [Oligosphaera ethanolica]